MREQIVASISQSFRGFLYATALAIGLSSYGQAAECTLKLQSTFDLKREPDGRFLVPVTLEDHPLKLMLNQAMRFPVFSPRRRWIHCI